MTEVPLPFGGEMRTRSEHFILYHDYNHQNYNHHHYPNGALHNSPVQVNTVFDPHPPLYQSPPSSINTLIGHAHPAQYVPVPYPNFHSLDPFPVQQYPHQQGLRHTHNSSSDSEYSYGQRDTFAPTPSSFPGPEMRGQTLDAPGITYNSQMLTPPSRVCMHRGGQYPYTSPPQFAEIPSYRPQLTPELPRLGYPIAVSYPEREQQQQAVFTEFGFGDPRSAPSGVPLAYQSAMDGDTTLANQSRKRTTRAVKRAQAASSKQNTKGKKDEGRLATKKPKPGAEDKARRLSKNKKKPSNPDQNGNLVKTAGLLSPPESLEDLLENNEQIPNIVAVPEKPCQGIGATFSQQNIVHQTSASTSNSVQAGVAYQVAPKTDGTRRTARLGSAAAHYLQQLHLPAVQDPDFLDFSQGVQGSGRLGGPDLIHSFPN